MRLFLSVCVVCSAMAGGAASAPGPATSAEALRAENDKLRADLVKLADLKTRMKAEIAAKGPYLLVNKYRKADGLGEC